MNLPLFLNASNAWRISLMEAGAAENSSISKYIPLIFSFLEALSMMEVGSKAEVVIPYQLAYGESGNQNPYTGEMSIEPFQTLVFELEIVDIVK